MVGPATYGSSMGPYKEPSSFNIVSFILLLLLLALAYGAWKYVPVYLQKQRIEEMMMQVIVHANRAQDGDLKTTIMQKLVSEHQLIDLSPEAVHISRRKGLDVLCNDKMVYADVTYIVRVNHLVGQVHVLPVKAEANRCIIDY